MPFEVLGQFFRCEEIHGVHQRLDDAMSCLMDMTDQFEGSIPVHPITQQHVFYIAAIDRKGNQRNFSENDKLEAKALDIDPRSLEMEVPTITNFSNMARIYCEALRHCPLLTIDFNGFFDFHDKNKHFWATDAGVGQALAYAQQAVFTLELSFKAYLEVLGKLASRVTGRSDRWQTHRLVDLYSLLDTDEEERLEAQWRVSEFKPANAKGTFKQYLTPLNGSYEKWRYPTDIKTTDLKSTTLSVDIPTLLSTSEFLLASSDVIFRERAPIKFNISSTIHSISESESGSTSRRKVTVHVEGTVQAINVPEGFSPDDLIEMEIDSDQREYGIVATFRRRDVEDYYGLTGTKVSLVGETKEDEPQILLRAYHLNTPDRPTAYTTEQLTLRGKVYDIRVVHSAYGGMGKVNLVLFDETFFTQVECFCVTDDEQALLHDVSLGNKVQISGLVTLRKGKPLVLVGPIWIEVVE